MMEFLSALIPETARIFYEGSFYILLGFAIAGLLHEFLPTDLIARHLGRESPRSIATAALFGAPIPLCSCGVLPAAAALRQKGAGRSPTMSFLVSTPETGVDSIALTYGLLGGVMAIVRPVVAVVTALVAGLLSMLFPGSQPSVDDEALRDLPLHSHDHGHGAELPSPSTGVEGDGTLGRAGSGPMLERLRRAVHYGFVTLLDDLAFWLLVGILLTGVLSAALPDDFFSAALGLDRGLLPMLLVILAGVPLYLCASASTPVAAALVAKGLSPGAALVFLLVGPATNAATIAVVGRLLGAQQLRIYLGSIVGVALVAGLLLDAFAADAVRRATLGALGGGDTAGFALLKILAAFLFVALLVLSGRRTRFQEGIHDLRDQTTRLMGALRAFEPRRLTSAPFLGGAAILAALTFLPNAFLVVEAGHSGIVQRFGRVVASDLEPGLHWHWPPPIGRGLTVDVARVRELGVGTPAPGIPRRTSTGSYYITADQNVIAVRGVVHYRVNDAVRFALGLEESGPLLESLARRELVRITTGTPIDTLYTTARRTTEEAFRRAIAERVAAAALGIEILDARLLDVHAPPSVHDAFRDVASAIEDREREIHEGNAYAAETTTTAQGEASEVREQARSDAARARALAQGSTAAFVGISDVHARHPRVTETRLYLETLERSLAKPHKYVNGASRDGGELDLWIGAADAVPPLSPGQAPTRRRAPDPPATTRGNL